MRVDGEVGAVMEQPVEDIGCFVGGGRDDLHIIRPVLIRDMGVERETGVNAIARIEIAGGAAAFAGTEKLTVGR